MPLDLICLGSSVRCRVATKSSGPVSVVAPTATSFQLYYMVPTAFKLLPEPSLPVFRNEGVRGQIYTTGTATVPTQTAVSSYAAQPTSQAVRKSLVNKNVKIFKIQVNSIYTPLNQPRMAKQFKTSMNAIHGYVHYSTSMFHVPGLIGPLFRAGIKKSKWIKQPVRELIKHGSKLVLDGVAAIVGAAVNKKISGGHGPHPSQSGASVSSRPSGPAGQRGSQSGQSGRSGHAAQSGAGLLARERFRARQRAAQFMSSSASKTEPIVTVALTVLLVLVLRWAAEL